MDIGISRKGLDKVLSGNISSEKYASAFNIPELIESSIKVSEADYNKPLEKQVENIKKYHYFDSDINIDGKPYIAHIRVRETGSGDKYYGHTLSGMVEKIEIKSTERTDTETVSWPVKKSVDLTSSTSILQNSEKINTSDENISTRGATTKSQKYQAKDLDLTLNQSAIRKIAYPEGYMGGKHNLGFYALEMLPEQLNDPVAILKSNTQDNSLVVLTEMINEHNQSVIIPIHLDKQGEIAVSNNIASAYGKQKINDFIEKGKKVGNLLYTKDKESLSKLPVNGLQLSEIVATKDPLYKNSILPNSQKVNTSDENIFTRGATTKSQKYQATGEKFFTDDVSKIFGVPKTASKNALSPIVSEMSEAVKSGTADPAKMDELFNKAYESGIITMDEYYNQYKDLKDEIKSNPISLSDTAKANIADYNDFRKHNFKNVKIRDDGVPVDVKYAELSQRHPDLFPSSITDEGEQIEHIAEVVKGIEKTKVSLDDYYGEDSDQFKEFARHEFDKKFNDYAEKMKYVARYENDQTAIAKKLEGKNATVAELREAHKSLKATQRQSDKITSKYLLTTKETKLIDSLLKGGVSVDDLDGISDINIANVKASYEAKKNVAEIRSTLDNYNIYRKQQLALKADELIKNSDNWKDKKTGLQYSRETMERNVEDIVKDKAEAKEINDYYFKPVHDNEASSNRFKNAYRARVKALELNEFESVYTQLYGEWKYQSSQKDSNKKSAKIAEDLEYKLTKFIEKNGLKIDKTKAEKAAVEFSKIYDELFEKFNDILVLNGYPAVEYKKGYFPHFEDERSKSKEISDISVKEKNLLEKAAQAIGFDISAKELPTDIAGLTHTFKPGKRWVGNFLQRTGETTDYDAILGFDRYIEGVSDVIHHTEDIQKLRQLENSLRLKYSDTGKQEGYKKIVSDAELTEDEKTARLDVLFGRDVTKLGHLAQEVRAYTDNLAGKKSLHDRTIESDASRAIYQSVVNLENRIASNMVAINPGSWLTNFIPLTQGSAQLSNKSMMKAVQDTLKAYKADDGFADRSTFLTNRKGSNALYMTTLSKMKDKLSSPMYHIDMFTSNVLTRARVYDNIERRKMSESDAMAEASEWTGRLMADRSKGALPTIFNRKNPVTKLLTMFQVEVNNQISHLFKDIPREYKQEGIAKLAGVLLQYVIGAFLYNELYENIIGRRPALDPIGMIKESFKAGKEGGTGSAVKSAGLSVITRFFKMAEKEKLPFVCYRKQFSLSET